MPGRLHALVLLAASSLPPADEVTPTETTLALPTGDGASEGVVSVEVRQACWLYVWAASDEIDPRLRLLGVDGRVLGEDDNAGGGTTAFLQVQVREPEALIAIVEGSTRDAVGSVRLHLAVEVEDPAVNDLLGPLASEFGELVEHWEAGERSAVHERLPGFVARVPRRADGTESTDGVTALRPIADLAATAGLADETLAARRRLHAQYARLLPPTHPNAVLEGLQLVGALHRAGKLREARELQRTLLETVTPLYEPGHPSLVSFRKNLAYLHFELAEFDEAQRLYAEIVAELEARGVRADDAVLADTRQALGAALNQLGRLEEAHGVFQRAHAELEALLPPDHTVLVTARSNLAHSLRDMGEPELASELHRRTLESRLRTLSPEHPEVLSARTSLAQALAQTGDREAAWREQEAVLETLLRRYPDDHLEVQRARLALSISLKAFGDWQGARELEERAVSVLAAYPETEELLKARGNLGLTLYALGNYSEARAIQEELLARLAAERAEDDADRNAARTHLAATLNALGEHERALELQRQHVAHLERTHPADHPRVLISGVHLAYALDQVGRFEEGSALLARTLPELEELFEEDHLELRQARRTHLWQMARLSRHDRVQELAEEIAAGLRTLVLRTAATRSPRETGELARSAGNDLGAVLFAARGSPSAPAPHDLRRAAFAAVETLRSAELLGPAASFFAGSDADVDQRRAECRRTSGTLARAVAEGEDAAVVRAAREARDAAWRALVASSGTGSLPEVTDESVRERLPEGTALVAFSVYTSGTLSDDEPPALRTEVALLAHVVRPGAELARVELGPLVDVAEAAFGWRDALRWGGNEGPDRGVAAESIEGDPEDERQRGTRLRRLVLDPVRVHLAGISRLVVLPDGPLQDVPLDALPVGDGRLGDAFRVSTRAAALELLLDRPAPAAAGLVVAGGIDYTRRNGATSSHPPSFRSSARALGVQGAFAPLPATETEVREIAAVFARAFGEAAPARLLSGSEATRERLFTEAERARWLHLATHGWFAAPDVDPSEGSRSSPVALAPLSSLEQRITGSSPLVLCGLALSGANAGAAVTAEELSALDLSGCELAVLSACDTGVGVARAGRGTASLRLALHMAGVRTAVTSLWKVDDTWTRRLMERFYTYLWVDGLPKADALWRAKRDLRDEGAAVRDWASWVLSGDPD